MLCFLLNNENKPEKIFLIKTKNVKISLTSQQKSIKNYLNAPIPQKTNKYSAII